MLYHWTTETVRWNRACRPEWHASFIQLGTSMSKALCVSILERWYILSLIKSFLGPRLFSLSRAVLYIYIFETKNHICLNQIAYLTLLIFWHARATSLIFFSRQAHPPPTVYEVKRSISSLTRLICLSELFPTLKIQSWIWNEKNRM